MWYNNMIILIWSIILIWRSFVNFGGFNMNGEARKIPVRSESLSGTAKALLTVIASFCMTFCGAWNLLGIASGDIRLLTLVGLLSMLVYFAVGGICTLLALEAPRLAPIPALVSFTVTFGLFTALNGGFRVIILAAALLSVFPTLGGAILAVTMRNGVKRPSAILASSVGTGIFTAAVLVLSVYLAGGVLSGESITAIVEGARTSLIEFFELQLETIKNKLPEYDVSAIEPVTMVNGIFNLLPALIVFVLNAIAFFSQLSLLALLRLFGLYHKLERTDIEFKVSPVTAAVFAVSFILSMVLSPNLGVALAVLDNLSMILMPAMAVVGLMGSLPRREGNTVKVGCFPLLLSGSLMMFMPALAMVVLAVFGTVYTFMELFSTLKKERQ